MTSYKNYSCYQDPKKNRIIIVLPQTIETMTNSLSPISDRKQLLTEAEEGMLVMVVQKMFEENK